MKLSIKLISFLVVLIILLFVSSFSFWYLGDYVQRVRPTFTAYYSKGTITRFSPTGNPMGYVQIYRLDGLYQSPQKIYTSPNEQYLNGPADFHQSKITMNDYTENQGAVNDTIPIVSKTTVDAYGRILLVNASDKLSTGQYSNIVTKQNPDGKYLLTSEVSCTKNVIEGPCPTTFSLRVYNKSTFTSTILNPKDFALPNGGALKIEVLDFISPTIALVLINDQQELYRQILATVDMQTNRVAVLWKNLITDTETTGQTFQFQWLQTDANSMIAIERRASSDTMSERFVSVNLQTMVVDPITDSIKGNSAILSSDLRGYYYSPGFNQGEWFHTIANNQDKQITPPGEITDFNPADRFIPITRFLNNSGNGPKEFSIYDHRKNKNKVIFEQKVSPWGSLPNVTSPDTTAARVGDDIFFFIGIDQ